MVLETVNYPDLVKSGILTDNLTPSTYYICNFAGTISSFFHIFCNMRDWLVGVFCPAQFQQL